MVADVQLDDARRVVVLVVVFWKTTDLIGVPICFLRPPQAHARLESVLGRRSAALVLGP